MRNADISRRPGTIERVFKNIISSVVVLFVCGIPAWIMFLTGIDWVLVRDYPLMDAFFWALVAAQCLLVFVFVTLLINIWTD